MFQFDDVIMIMQTFEAIAVHARFLVDTLHQCKTLVLSVEQFSLQEIKGPFYRTFTPT